MPETYEAQPLAVREASVGVAIPTLFTAMRPAEKVALATEMADALKDVLVKRGLVKRLNRKNPDDEYVELEGWQLCASLSGCSAKIEWTHKLEDGWEARAVVVRLDNGLEIGSGEGMCTRKEGNWGGRDEFAIRAMAQTRAQSRALRGVLAWVLVLAGFKPTPSAEIPPETPEPVRPVEPEPAKPVTSDDRKALLARVLAHNGVTLEPGQPLKPAIGQRIGTHIMATLGLAQPKKVTNYTDAELTTYLERAEKAAQSPATAPEAPSEPEAQQTLLAAPVGRKALTPEMQASVEKAVLESGIHAADLQALVSEASFGNEAGVTYDWTLLSPKEALWLRDRLGAWGAPE